jgi:hypothetical protein
MAIHRGCISCSWHHDFDRVLDGRQAGFDEHSLSGQPGGVVRVDLGLKRTVYATICFAAI